MLELSLEKKFWKITGRDVHWLYSSAPFNTKTTRRGDVARKLLISFILFSFLFWKPKPPDLVKLLKRLLFAQPPGSWVFTLVDLLTFLFSFMYKIYIWVCVYVCQYSHALFGVIRAWRFNCLVRLNSEY